MQGKGFSWWQWYGQDRMASTRAICDNNDNFKKVSKPPGLLSFLLGLGGIRILLKKMYIFPLIDSNNENLLGTQYCGSNLPINYFQLFKMHTILNLNKAFHDSG